ncbi:MAG: CRISPR-associated endonuclease Cas2 [Blastocatellia bacterium]
MTKIVIMYDISDDRTRTKLFKLLKRYGEPVQLSIFEAIISESQFAEMRRDVARTVSSDAGQVHYYEICQTCDRGMVIFGQARTTVLAAVYIA